MLSLLPQLSKVNCSPCSRLCWFTRTLSSHQMAPRETPRPALVSGRVWFWFKLQEKRRGLNTLWLHRCIHVFVSMFLLSEDRDHVLGPFEVFYSFMRVGSNSFTPSREDISLSRTHAHAHSLTHSLSLRHRVNKQQLDISS